MSISEAQSENIITRSGLDRLRYTLLFEIILIISSTAVIAFILKRDLMEITFLALILSTIAMAINYFYNYAYDYFDVSQGRIPTERSVKHRVFHAVGFELFLLFFTLPIIMWWLELSFINALLLDIGMMAAVVVYTFLFGLGYDRAFPIRQPEQLIISGP
ncbi:PACE efflux transporter [Neptunomonas sp.]|uniref:PACE efflux transporter n=1 Tax=Neptunomonas sp. TaxID=1971898 RepID=UPI0025D4EBCA|nr:PACE efflux transporter [Neptunomonas sp.]